MLYKSLHQTLHQSFLTIVSVLCVLSLTCTNADGDEYRYGVDDFLVYAEGNISFRERSTVSGNIATGGTLTIREDSAYTNGDLFADQWVSIRHRTTIAGFVLSGGNTDIFDDADISGLLQSVGPVTIYPRVRIGGDVIGASTVSLKQSATVEGSVSEYAALPHSWVAPTVVQPSFTPGSTDVTITSGQTQTVAPGNYGVLRLQPGSTIQLSAGSYHFSTVQIDQDVTFDVNDSAGPVNVYVNNNFSIRERPSFTVDSEDPSGFVLWVSGSVSIREDCEFTGTIRCFGNVSLRERTAFVGSIYAQGYFSGSVDSTFEMTTAPPIFYVRIRGSDSSDGLTPQTAFRTIQHAVNSCDEPGYTIYVGSGTYQENVEIGTGAGTAAVSGTAAKPNRIVGDVDGLYTLDDPGEVLIDGRGNEARGIDIRTRDHWEFDSLTIRNTQTYGIYGNLCGFRATNCTIDVPAGYGIYATASSDLTVEDSTFERDSTSRHICWIVPSQTTDPIEIRINRNDATRKGDLFQSIGYQNGWNTIRYLPWQSRYLYGFIVFGWGANIDSIEINNNQISDCYLPLCFFGYSNSMDLSMSNNTLSGCFFGPYAYMYRSGTPTLNNNIVDTSYYGLLVWTYQSGTPVVGGLIEHNIGYPMSAYRRPFEFDIITADPQFTDPAAGDFSVAGGSPAVDAGVDLNAPATDIAGRSRPTDGDSDGVAQVDIGAYELVNEQTRVRVVQWREIGTDGNR